MKCIFELGGYMKKLFMIGGTMGVGKTTISQKLCQELDCSVFLDGDWCWDMHPFVVNDETKLMVMKNITYQLNQFIHCSVIENIVFCWVMHEQTIINEILSEIDLTECEVYAISLICSKDSLKTRIEKDIREGIRKKDVLDRSLERLDMYKMLDTMKIETTNLSVEETVEAIKEATR